MMKAFLRFLLGLSGAVLIRGCRFGLREFIRAGYAGLSAVHPFQPRKEKEVMDLLLAIPQMPLSEILGNRKPQIKLLLEPYEDGMLGAQEAVALLGILIAENPREVLEIGTYMGHTTKRMAENLDHSIIHTIDLPLDFSIAQDQDNPLPKDDFHLITRRVVGRQFKGQHCETRIVQHFGDTAKMDFNTLGEPSFFFIDGSHTYEYCRQDSEKCLRLCRPGATFLWHDCDEGHPEVLKFLLEWRDLGRKIVRIEGTALAYWKAPG
jgi:hypothetical protein